MINYSSFEINSDFPTDEVILCNEINLTETSTRNWNGVLYHSLGFKPLPFAMFQFNNDGLWLNAGKTDSSDAISMNIVGYSDRIEINVVVPSSLSVGSVKARIFALLPSDQNRPISHPTTFGSFNVNSEYNYDMLVAQGVKTISDQYNVEQTIYEHNLGHIPRVMLWQEDISGNAIRPLDPAYSKQSEYGLPSTIELRATRITSTGLYIWYYGQTTLPNIKIHYRIYSSRMVQEGV